MVVLEVSVMPHADPMLGPVDLVVEEGPITMSTVEVAVATPVEEVDNTVMAVAVGAPIIWAPIKLRIQVLALGMDPL